MEITVNIPDELAHQIIPEGLHPSRQALEDKAVEPTARIVSPVRSS